MVLSLMQVSLQFLIQYQHHYTDCILKINSVMVH